MKFVLSYLLVAGLLALALGQGSTASLRAYSNTIDGKHEGIRKQRNPDVGNQERRVRDSNDGNQERRLININELFSADSSFSSDTSANCPTPPPLTQPDCIPLLFESWQALRPDETDPAKKFFSTWFEMVSGGEYPLARLDGSPFNVRFVEAVSSVDWNFVEFSTNMLGRADREFCAPGPKRESSSPFDVFGSNRKKNSCCGGGADQIVEPGEYWIFAEATGNQTTSTPVVCQSLITFNLAEAFNLQYTDPY